MSENNYLIWQLIDSALPTGALSHSGGLESWLQIQGIDDIVEKIRALVLQTCAQQLPLLMHIYSHPGDLITIDRQLQALMTNAVAQRASIAQGKALLSIAQKILPGLDLSYIRRSVKEKQIAGHYVVVYGCICASLEFSVEQCRETFIFALTRDLFSAAVRLGICGPMAAQRLQFVLLREINAQIHHVCTDTAQHIHPIQEIVHGMHDRLYSRLFAS